MRTEQYIRFGELWIALMSTFLVAITLIRTAIYASIKPYITLILGPIILTMGLSDEFVDIILLVLIMMLSFLFWRGGEDIHFGRLFTLNMLLFFPAVIDYSTFNWVNIILPYNPTPTDADRLWVFGVGIMLQIAYLFLRYTVRFRYGRTELLNRGAEIDDVDKVSWGQMYYLAALVAGTSVICFILFQIYPYLDSLLDVAKGLPIPHITIGIAISLVVAGATVLYLRSSGEDIEE